MVMSTELLRFGSNPYAVQEMIKVIEGMQINGVKCRVFTLKEAYLDQNTALMAWKKLADNKARLSKDIGSQRIPAKQVPVDEKKEADRNVLKDRAAEIESYVRVNKALPKDVYELIEFVHPTKTPSNRLEKLRKNFVKAQDVMAGRKESSMSSMKHVTEVISSQKVDNAFSSLEMCVYRGTNFLPNPKSAQDAFISCAAMYFRTSPSTISSTVCIEIKDDGSGSVMYVPLHQMCVNIARLLKYHKKQRGDQQGGKIQVTIYYDEMKSRDACCNPQFASFVDGIYKNKFDLAMASRSNRCSSHLTSYYLLNKTCESTDTDLEFSEQTAKMIRRLPLRKMSGGTDNGRLLRNSKRK
uniref:Uncharacterized protein n=1 Tax=Skeletonema marinoi TaxID=267567 RepID=A0A7S2L8I6_9STRA|mmetsp:Transcript_21587/g.36677  ORF Transcript_21587/g.36677 Transcript_21587/m.36677 type:complete len:354 (+) Transcript_21587:71-1132(+)